MRQRRNLIASGLCAWFVSFIVLVWCLGDPEVAPLPPGHRKSVPVPLPSSVVAGLHGYVSARERAISLDGAQSANAAAAEALDQDEPEATSNSKAIMMPTAATLQPRAEVDAEAAEAAGAVAEASDGIASSSVGRAKTRVLSDAGVDTGASSATAVPAEHAALQGTAVELLTAHSECAIQTFTGRHAAQASSVYSAGGTATDPLEANRHGAALAFDADSTTAWHGACGLPNAPWRLSYRFAEPTTASLIKLTSDAPADFPKEWELQASNDGKRFTTLLRISRDAGIAADCIHQLRRFRCDRPRTRTYEVRAPGDYVEYALVVRSVSNVARGERNCLQLAEVSVLC